MTQTFALFSSTSAPFAFPGTPFAIAALLAIVAGWIVVRREA